MDKLYRVSKTRPGADCDLLHELLIAKFRLNPKKVGKTTRPFRYDLNQIPNDYIVKVRYRFKGLVLINRVPDELWTEVRDNTMCDIIYSGYDVINIVGAMTCKQLYDGIKRGCDDKIVPMVSYMQWL